MNSIFTSDDLRKIIDNVFKTNDEYFYETNGEKVSLVSYLSPTFYSWKNRVVSETDDVSVYESWVNSLNTNLDKIYGLVEMIDNEATASPDIDSATMVGRITFLVPTNKVANLDYYCAKLRKAYMGVPQDMQNSLGDALKAYINIGILLYDGEPEMTQIGETITATLNFDISYLNDAREYSDQVVSLSFDGTTYYQAPITKSTWQVVFGLNAVPKQSRPDITGFVASSVSNVSTLSFFDYDKDLTNTFNEMFWSFGAISIDGTATTTQDVNVPIWVKVVASGHTYIYKYLIDNMEKVISNGAFNICSITLKGYGKE